MFGSLGWGLAMFFVGMYPRTIKAAFPVMILFKGLLWITQQLSQIIHVVQTKKKKITPYALLRFPF